MTYPNTPGYKEETTSKEAAESMATKASTLRAKALMEILKSPHGMTADEVAARLGETILAIRPRISELRKQRLIQNSGLKRLNSSGKNAIVWKRPEPLQETIFTQSNGCKDCGSNEYFEVYGNKICDPCFEKRSQFAKVRA